MHTFKPHEKTSFTPLRIIFQNDTSSIGRDYQFLARTYTLESIPKVIDSQILGPWIEKEKKICYGTLREESLTQKLVLRRNCEDGTQAVFTIDNQGQFIQSSHTVND